PAAITIQCHINPIPANTGQATAIDNCTAPGSITITYSNVIMNGSCTNRYTITRTWKATDAAGNMTTGIQIIKVIDTTPPVVNCNSFSVANPDSIPVPNSNTLTITDNCGGTITAVMTIESYTGLDQESGFCPSSVLRTWLVTDACGNTATCVQTITVLDISNCSVCQEIVPFYPAILTGDPDSLWISPNHVRDGICCDASGPPPPRCTSFNVLLDENAVGLVFDIASGAVPPGALYYQVDCGPLIPVGDIICLAGGEFHTITFCKPGNNANTYSIQSISGAVAGDTLITRADPNCPGQLSVSGIVASTAIWTVVSPPDQSLLAYLSCTNCLNPVFTPDINSPPVIVYQVCGTVNGSLICDGVVVTDCAEVIVEVIPQIMVEVIVPPIICQNGIPQLEAIVSPPNTYLYQLYNGSNGSGVIIYSGGALFTPTAAGNYSVIVTENLTGILCNKDTANFTIAFELMVPVINVPPMLIIECNTPGADLNISDWLASATAFDDIDPDIILLVTNDYSPFTHSCDTGIIVTFSTVDSCGNVATDTS
ncbi:MAG: hypothetical protein ABIT06_06225, partial [Saprospiraceae bacterium]